MRRMLYVGHQKAFSQFMEASSSDKKSFSFWYGIILLTLHPNVDV